MLSCRKLKLFVTRQAYFCCQFSKGMKKILSIIIFSVPFFNHIESQSYLKGDFHQHTTYTDGSFSIGYMMKKNNDFGLDWWANSEHGGESTRNAAISGADVENGKTTCWDEMLPSLIIGSEKTNYGHQVMWRWQVLRDYSFAEVLKARQLYKDKTILQSYEMNIPGHEHGSLGIINHQFDINPHCIPLAEFEYKFDQNDEDTIGGQKQGWTKSKSAGHQKALESLTWLRTKYPYSSYLIIAHPERKPQHDRGYTIASIRDFNNEAPTVCFGFESVPGHHREAERGGYHESSVGGGTYGGSGIFSAKIGGLWDALLTEGRHFWLFSNSDYHSEKGEFYPGEYQKNHTFTQGKSAQQIIDGLRSGNNWVVNGDLIDSLIFTLSNTTTKATAQMGETLKIPANKTVRITIKARDPQQHNHNTYSDYRNPELDHIDIIMGEVHQLIQPDDINYNTDSVTTTAVYARFDKNGGTKDLNGIVSKKWKQTGNGWVEMTLDLKSVRNNMYLRLRGTNHGLNVVNETDANGNPLCDTLVGVNNATKAFADLWFYSNPVFISIKK